MSYILDALKKNQAEQAPEMPGLRLDGGSPENKPKTSWQLWVSIAVGVLLLLNLGFLGWQAITPDVEETARIEKPVTATRSVQPQATRTHPSPQPVQENASATPTTEPVATANIRVIQPKQESEQDIVIAPAQAPTAAPIQTDVERVQLSSLPQREQILYSSFEFTSHIYTDEPEDCAIVVNGYRLTVGDGFKGLTVVEITPEGVIFAETRRGVERHVEVSILDLWAAEG